MWCSTFDGVGGRVAQAAYGLLREEMARAARPRRGYLSAEGEGAPSPGDMATA